MNVMEPLVSREPYQIRSQNLAGQHSASKIGSFTQSDDKRIYFLQEVPQNLKLNDCRYEIEKFHDSTYLKTSSFILNYKKKQTGVYFPNIGMRTSIRQKKRIPKQELHGTMVLISGNLYIHEYKIPKYMMTSFISGGTEIGMRSTCWVIIKDWDTGKSFAVISVHGNNNNTKRELLINSLFEEGSKFNENDMGVIIAGDFNEFPHKMSKFMNHKFFFTPSDPKKMTHISNVRKFSGSRIDWVFLSHNLKNNTNEKVSGLNQDKKIMNNCMKKKNLDHSVLQVTFNF